MNYFLVVSIFTILSSRGIVISAQNSTTPAELTTTTLSSTIVLPTTSTVAPPTQTSSITQDLPTTTTPKVPTTTPDVPTTTKAPEPEEGLWNVTDGNLTCIRAELKVTFKIHTEGQDYSINLSPNATSTLSDCHASNTTQTLILVDTAYTLSLIFGKDSSDVFIRNITLVYTLPDESGIVYNDTKMFSVKAGHSYLCKATTNVVLRNVTMEIFHMHIQAFEDEGNNNFSLAENCEADDKVSDIVPIAVACALAGLIVVVLIAYLIGRRRKTQKGYQSV